VIDLTPQEAVDLPTDELALHLLADMVDAQEWNEYNYVLRYKHDRQRGYGTDHDAMRAIAEAVGWLRANGMIARKPGDTNVDAIFITRWGHEALATNLASVRAIIRLRSELHPSLQHKVRRQFLLGEHETAIFVAMRAVEVRVRQLAGFGDDVIGTDLMKRAFKPGGPLADPKAPVGEIDGTMALFWGTYSVLRNPSGHREVSFDDVSEAAEAVMTASLLMRILDRVERWINS
jgi:uncharacterized protein (TIGR02391 family)